MGWWGFCACVVLLLMGSVVGAACTTGSTTGSTRETGFDIPDSALPYDDDVEVLATAFTRNIYDTTPTSAGTVGLSLSKAGVNMPVHDLQEGILVSFPTHYTHGLLSVPAYWNGTHWSGHGLHSTNTTTGTTTGSPGTFLSFSSSHLTDFSATTVVDPATVVVSANHTAVQELLAATLGSTGST